MHDLHQIQNHFESTLFWWIHFCFFWFTFLTKLFLFEPLFAWFFHAFFLLPSSRWRNLSMIWRMVECFRMKGFVYILPWTVFVYERDRYCTYDHKKKKLAYWNLAWRDWNKSVCPLDWLAPFIHDVTYTYIYVLYSYSTFT